MMVFHQIGWMAKNILISYKSCTFNRVINPGLHGPFQADKLQSLWKVMQSEYDTIVTKYFFTRVAKKAIDGDESNNDGEFDEDGDDEFYVESGRGCCYTKSIFCSLPSYVTE